MLPRKAMGQFEKANGKGWEKPRFWMVKAKILQILPMTM